MSREIDERVVEMRFNNAQFEQNAAKTMSTLDKFKEKLNFKGMSQGVTEFGSAFQTNMAKVEESTNKVQATFSAFQVIGMTALSRITNAAISAGTRIAKSLTIDPVKTGMQEYELKLNSIQTILANTKRHGSTLEDVSNALDELNHYADKTIYNFGQMTTAIGMFTTAGVDLEQSVASVKGISNLAAFVGAPAQDATRAMYQLSQALSTGIVRLEDWRSLEHTAGMSGIEFQERLKDTARILGMSVDAAIEKNGNFRESLKEGWLTTEVLTETLKQFAGEVDEVYLKQQGWSDEQIKSIMYLGKTATESATIVKSFTQLLDTSAEAAQSGWAESWEIIIGSLEEAKELWTAASQVIGGFIDASAKARNEILKQWKDWGGRTDLIKGVANVFKALQSIIIPIRDAFHDLFPPVTARTLMRITLQFRLLAAHMKLSEEAAYTLKVAVKAVLLPFKLLFEILKVGVKLGVSVVRTLFKMGDAFLSLFSKASPLEGVLKKIFGESRYTKMAEALKRIMDRLGETFSKIKSKLLSLIPVADETGEKFSIFKKLKEYLDPIVGKLLDYFVAAFTNLSKIDFRPIKEFTTNILRTMKEQLSGVVDLLGSMKGGIGSFFASLKDMSITDMLNAALDGIKNIWGFIVKIFTEGNFGEFFGDIKEKGSSMIDILKRLGEAIADFVKRLSPAKILIFSFGVAVTGLMFTLRNTLTTFSGLAASMTQVIKSIFVATKPSKIAEIARAITLLSGALVAMSMVDPQNLRQATISMGIMMASLAALVAVMALLDKFLIDEGSIVKVAGSMQTMAIALAALSGALLILSNVTMDWSLVGKVGMLVVLMGALAGSMALLGTIDVNLGKNVWFVLAFSISIGAIVKSLEKIANVDFKQIVAGLGSLTLVMGLLAGLSFAAGRVRFGSAMGITVMCLNIITMVGVLKLLGLVNVDEIIDKLETLLPLFGVMGMIAVISNRISPSVAQAGLGFAAISASFLILDGAIRNIGQLSLSEVSKGTAVVAAVLGMFALISQNFRRVSQNATKAGAAIFAMSMALLPITLVIKLIGSFKMEEVLQGMLAVTALFALFALIVKVGTTAEKATAPILSVTLALGLLSTAISLMTLLPTKELLASSLALSVAIAAFGFAMNQMKDIGAMSIAKSLAAIGLVVGSLILLFSMLSKVDLSGLNLEVIDTISKAVISLSAMLAAFGQIGELGLKPAMVAVLALDAILLSISALLIGFGALMEIDAVKRFAEQGVEFFGLVGQAIGSLVGGFVRAVGEMVSAMLPTIATNLSLFMTNLQPFIQQVSSIDLSFVTGMITLVAAMAVLTAGGVLTAFMTAIGGGVGIAAMAVELPAFGEAMKKFSDAISQNGGIDSEAVNACANMAGAMAALQEGLPREFGLIDALLGSKMTLDDFGTKMVAFGKSMVAYSAIVSPEGAINSDAVQNSVNAAKMLNDLETSLPRQFGVLQLFLGSKSLFVFGNELTPFGEAIVAYSQTITKDGGINSEAIESSVAAATLLRDLEAGLPRSFGLLQAIIGGKSLESFGKELVKLGEGIKGYSDAITADGGLDTEAIETSKKVMDSFVELSDSLGRTGGLISLFSREGDLGDLGSKFRLLGSGLQSYYNAIKEINFGTINTSAMTIKYLGDSCTGITTEMATSMINGLASQHAEVLKAGEDLVNSIITGIRNIVPGMRQAGVDVMMSFLDGVKAQIDTLKTAIAGLIASAFPSSSVDPAYSDAYRKAGEAILNGMVSGIKASKKIIEDAVDLITSGIINAANEGLDIRDFSSREFEKIGEYIVTGLSNGLAKDQTSVMDAVLTLSQRVYQKFRSYFIIESPSKLMRDEVGRYIVRGISEGITTDTSAEEAAEKKASNIANAFQTVFSKLDTKKSTIDLEDQLWTALNPNASEEETKKRAKEKLDKEMKLQAEAVRTAEAEYEAVVQVMGKTSDQATSAYNKLLQEKIELAQLAQQLAGERGAVAQNTQVAYARLMAENKEDLMKMGFTEEQIASWAEEKSGYSPGQKVKEEVDNTLETAMKSGNIEAIMKAYLDPIPEVIVQTIDEGIQNGSRAAGAGGGAIGEQLGGSMVDKAVEKVKETGGTIVETIKDVINGDVTTEELSDRFAGSATAILDGFLNTISSGGREVADKLGGLAQTGLDAFNNLLGIASPSKVFEQNGYYIVEGLVGGVKNSRVKFEQELETLANNGAAKFDLAMSIGFKQNQKNSMDAVTNLVNAMGKAITDQNSNFKTYGKNLSGNMVDGLKIGIQENRSKAINEIVKLAVDAYEAAKDTLEIASPSKKFEQLGEYVSIGFANGITNESGRVADASDTLTDNLLDDTSSAILHANKIIEDQEYAPIIRPVVDLQQVQKEMDSLNSQYSQSLVGTVSSEISRKSSGVAIASVSKYGHRGISGSQKYGTVLGVKGNPAGGDRGSARSGTSVTFIQNNTSPKALSSATIYRNTKNGLARAVKNARTVSKKS